MESVKEKIILIFGGTNLIGEGIVKVFLEKGATVIVPSNSEEKICKLRNHIVNNHEKLYTPLANIINLANANELLSWIKVELKYIDAVLACDCEWWQGAPLLDVSLDTWQKLLNNGLTTHFILAKTFLPFLFKRVGSSYIIINSRAGLNAIPHAGPISVSAAGEIMLKEVLNLENQNQPVRINTLLIDSPLITTGKPDEKVDYLSAEDAGTYCIYLLSEAAHHIKGQTILLNSKAQVQQLYKAS